MMGSSRVSSDVASGLSSPLATPFPLPAMRGPVESSVPARGPGAVLSVLEDRSQWIPHCRRSRRLLWLIMCTTPFMLFRSPPMWMGGPINLQGVGGWRLPLLSY
eukprot:3272702-Pyramimonas_sp.AAC.1